jgi:protein phosphatase PTC7
VVYKSQEQQVRFNMPLAVGTDSNLTSKSAVTVSLPVRRGDIILAATDGVFDNLFLNDILQVVSRTLAERAYCGCTQPLEEQVADAGRLADAVTDAAVAAAMHPTKRGPFAAQCEKSGYAFDGGKMDDITAVVALVTCDVD